MDCEGLFEILYSAYSVLLFEIKLCYQYAMLTFSPQSDTILTKHTHTGFRQIPCDITSTPPPSVYRTVSKSAVIVNLVETPMGFFVKEREPMVALEERLLLDGAATN